MFQTPENGRKIIVMQWPCQFPAAVRCWSTEKFLFNTKQRGVYPQRSGGSVGGCGCDAQRFGF